MGDIDEDIEYSNKTGRGFIGSLYVTNKESTDYEEMTQEVVNRLDKTKHITWARWSLERGKKGNLHWQIACSIDWKASPCRPAKIGKDMKNVKGEMFFTAHHWPKVKNYVKKEETHVAGPWEWQRNALTADGKNEDKSSETSGRVPTAEEYPATFAVGLKAPAPGWNARVDKEFWAYALKQKWNEIQNLTKMINQNVTVEPLKNNLI